MVQPTQAWPNKTVYGWKRLNTRTEIHALYVAMTGKIVGYVIYQKLLDNYKVILGETTVGEYISLETAKMTLDDLCGMSTIQ